MARDIATHDQIEIAENGVADTDAEVSPVDSHKLETTRGNDSGRNQKGTVASRYRDGNEASLPREQMDISLYNFGDYAGK